MRQDGSVLELEQGVVVGLPTFDLHRVERALLDNHRIFNGLPMSRVEVEVAVHEYREFLWQHKLAGTPERFTVPSLTVDRVWHTRMCETQQYREDCQSYFGKIVEHASNICQSGDEVETYNGR